MLLSNDPESSQQSTASYQFKAKQEPASKLVAGREQSAVNSQLRIRALKQIQAESSQQSTATGALKQISSRQPAQ